MSNMLFTHNGHNMFDISSLIQKALRRGDMEFACYAAHEMMWKYRPYLWTRLFITSAEDCYDPVSGRILYLRKKDMEVKDAQDTRYLSEAVNLLVRTRKNRDADFFACNYVCSKDKRDFPMGTTQLVTRHGHDLREMTIALKKAVFNLDDENVGYICCEIWCWYKRLFWVVAKDIAKELGSGLLVREIKALMEIDMTMNAKNSTWIYMCKAIVLFSHCVEVGSCDIFSYPDMSVIYDVMKFNTPVTSRNIHTTSILVKERQWERHRQISESQNKFHSTLTFQDCMMKENGKTPSNGMQRDVMKTMIHQNFQRKLLKK